MSELSELALQLREVIESSGYRHSDRLEPERKLCDAMGTTRHKLRLALKELEAEGLIWRHVGRGTFVGSRSVLNLQDVTYLRDQVDPRQISAVRLNIEPELSRLAALHATQRDRDRMRLCADRCRTADDWRTYEAWDNNLHHAIARATRNQLFLYFFETLNSVRRATASIWAQPRTNIKPASDYSGFAEHDAIVDAIEAKDAHLAARKMRTHLKAVQSRVPTKNLTQPK